MIILSRANLNTGMNYLKMGDFKRGFHYVDLKSDGAWRLGKNFDVQSRYYVTLICGTVNLLMVKTY